MKSESIVLFFSVNEWVSNLVVASKEPRTALSCKSKSFSGACCTLVLYEFTLAVLDQEEGKAKIRCAVMVKLDSDTTASN